MKYLFLRGQVPQDRNPQEIVFNTINECDDVWTQLIYAMTRSEDETELWYWNGNREHKFSQNFTERWVPNFNTYRNEFEPDVIFCRGGFPEYHSVLKRFPKAFKIYYGAGRRFLPQAGFSDYDLILQDSPEQVDICKSKYPNIETTLFIKPACDNLFYPKNINKEYDIVFPANGTQEAIKGHKFVFSTVPKNYKILNLGNKGKISPPKNIERLRVLKTQMSDNLQRAKVGIVCCNSNVDSCPRVIPEMIACNIPIICFEDIRFWREKYITPQTGVLANKDNFWLKVDYVLNNLDKFTPKNYYDDNLTLTHAARYINDKIRKLI
jgi:hypothetical protein